MRMLPLLLLILVSACAETGNHLPPPHSQSQPSPARAESAASRTSALAPSSEQFNSLLSLDQLDNSFPKQPIGVLSLLGNQFYAFNQQDDRRFVSSIDAWDINNWLQNESIRYMKEHNWHNLEPIKGLDQFEHASYLDQNLISYAKQQGYQLLLVFTPIGQLHDPYWYQFSELANSESEDANPPSSTPNNFGFNWYYSQGRGSASVYCRFEVSLFDLIQQRVIGHSGPLKSNEYDTQLPWHNQLSDYSNSQQNQLREQLQGEFALQIQRNLDQILLHTTDNGEAERVQQRNNQAKDVFILDQLLRSSR